MLLTITTTRSPATDLGYLLHKHPAKCQTFWAALLVCAVARGLGRPLACIASAFAYSGSAVALRTWLRTNETASTERPHADRGRPGCRACGN